MAVCDPFRQQFRRYLIEKFKDQISNKNDYFFLSIGKISEWEGSTGTNDDFPPKNVDSVFSDTEFFRNILAYKRIKPENISLVIPRYDWQPGIVYTPYRDNVDLYDDNNPSQFYILVDEERVYKCIDNAYDSASTVAPTHTDPEIRLLSDGYRWKFLYQIPESKRKFLTKGFANNTGFMPVEYVDHLKDNDDRSLQWVVQQASVDGSIDFIELNETIRSQIISDKVVFYRAENQIVNATGAGAEYVVISGPNIIYSNDYYNGMVFRIESGMGSGQQRVITDYSAGSNTATVYFDYPLDYGVTAGTGSDLSLYSILPQVKIIGDGNSYNNTLNTQIPRAEATVKFLNAGTTGTTGAKYLDSIDIINSGQNYTYATVNIISGLTSAPGLSADLTVLARAVLPPQGGHGSNPIKELGTSALMIVMDFSQDEDGKLSIDNEYRQFGIIKNPELFYTRNRLFFENSGLTNSFTGGDIIYQGTSVGIVEDWFEGLSGSSGTSELDIKVISGTFAIGATVTNGFLVKDIQEKTLAGEEGKNVLKVKMVPVGSTGTLFNPNGTDFFRGQIAISVGNTSDSVYSTYSAGRVYKWQPEAGTNAIGDLYLEEYHGDFAIDEYVGHLNKSLTNYSGPIGKITETEVTEYNNMVTYTQTSQIKLAYNGIDSFTASSFTADSLVTSLSGSTEIAYGYVVSWDPATGSTQGYLLLNGLQERFLTGHTIFYNNVLGNTGATIINIISEPDILYHSGEIYHIQNIRPIERSIEQREEFKFIVEF